MSGQNNKTEQRKQRLAKALKANIAKRKTQAKTRTKAEEPAETPPKEEGCRN
jgi:ribosomal protein L39E